LLDLPPVDRYIKNLRSILLSYHNIGIRA
jgi:hypothetical protein